MVRLCGCDVIIAICGETINVYDALPLQPFPSVAAIVKLKTPVWVVVPVSTPVPERGRPAGGAPLGMAKVAGVTAPPLCVIVWLYGMPVAPLMRVVVDSVIVGHVVVPPTYAFR